ncbi:acetyl-coenzyme A transporter 1-like [Rhopalosiphum maidis]|uniref:acetyl-coenzyme A transporter 1-like n=1 Tax=Rhopalosiphum maidis TaxID=43146 RepID=UPI000EFF711D|nr:acetyl-coenzyme A transporter 1-like [Rhopalosiphum maidis]
MTVPQVEDEQEHLSALTVVDDSNSADVPNLKGDWHNIFILLVLYTMQGIAGFGFYKGVMILMQTNKHITYKVQALFSIVTWPYNLKMIWAPLVDAFCVQKMGRRKSWLIPIQYLIGGCFIYIGNNINEWLPETEKPDVLKLFYAFLFLQILVATQDIVVDSWALTMLKKNNVVYASTCNAVGAPLGIMMGSFFLVLFTSENFCNTYLRFAPVTGGIVTKEYLFYCLAVLLTLITTLILIFKKEKEYRSEDNYIKLNVIQNYLLIWDILKKPSFRVLMLALLTEEIGFATTVPNLLILKLIETGMPKDNIMVISSSTYIVNIITPIIISKYTSGPKPMSLFLKVTPFRLIVNIMFVIFLYHTTKFLATYGNTGFPIYYYAVLALIFIINNVLGMTMKVSKFSLFNRISDPRFGGTYMALLCTFYYLGTFSSTSLAISMIDILTFKECPLNYNNNCSTSNQNNTCKTNGSSCVVTVNGYYVESALCILFGIGWYYIFRGILKKLQVKSPSHWMVNVKNNKMKKNKTAEHTMVENS